jgi:hypothetical protein
MSVADEGQCESFRASTDTPEFSPFYGEYASTGTSSDTDYSTGSYTAPAPTGPGDNSAGGENYDGGYDPRLYESPPQEAPEEPEPETDGGGIAPPGNGQGNANGQSKGDG